MVIRFLKSVAGNNTRKMPSGEIVPTSIYCHNAKDVVRVNDDFGLEMIRLGNAVEADESQLDSGFETTSAAGSGRKRKAIHA